MSDIRDALARNQAHVSFLAGVLLVIGGHLVYQQAYASPATYEGDEVHVHADFLLYINDEQIDFSGDQYQSSATQVLHPDFHFHDNEDHIIHRHAADLTLAAFLDSLGYTLTNECITTDSGQTHCSDEESELLLYVNGQTYDDITSYIPEDEDQVLLYYGAPDNLAIETYLDEVTDKACIYSGTCPERGLPPPESCGITCEI